jgi:uncharacterized protein DUF5677
MPENLKESVAHFESLIMSIEKEMDGASVPNGGSTRWQIASTSLYLATQHARAICILVQRHDNEAAGLHLRALFEVYIRLVYMLSKADNSRLLAVLYADAVSYERYSKDVKKVNLDAYESVSSEVQDRLNQLNARVEVHIKDTKQQEKVYRKQLESMDYAEFLGDKSKLKSGDSISQQLSIKYMCRCLQDINGQNLLKEYASIYSNLSMYAHTSTVYLVKMIHKQPDGSIRIGTVSGEENEEASIRNIATAHHYLAGLILQCLREKGLSQRELDDRLNILENSKAKYGKFLTI